MESLIDSIVEFIRVRQLNIAIAALLSIVYIAYQYRKILFKVHSDDEDEPIVYHTARVSRSRSRSYSRSRSRPRSANSYRSYKVDDTKSSRRGRKTQRRCPNCRNDYDIN
ncbi:unnamed protein product [Parnassius mnemosyne]|uniref:Uncharacterized protein n=1 Tax=Parnassius mnemosyne TaxID=213953 RepID=A0AAV1KYP2_9NEOP